MPDPQPQDTIPPMLFGNCRHCGYSLKNITQPRCPECGTTFNPDDPRTLQLQPSHLTRFLMRKTTFWTFFPAFLAAGGFIAARFVYQNPTFANILLWPTVILFIGTAYIVTARARFQLWLKRRALRPKNK